MRGILCRRSACVAFPISKVLHAYRIRGDLRPVGIVIASVGLVIVDLLQLCGFPSFIKSPPFVSGVSSRGVYDYGTPCSAMKAVGLWGCSIIPDNCRRWIVWNHERCTLTFSESLIFSFDVMESLIKTGQEEKQ